MTLFLVRILGNQYRFIAFRNFFFGRIHAFFSLGFCFFSLQFSLFTKCSAQREDFRFFTTAGPSQGCGKIRATPKPYVRGLARLITQSVCHHESMLTKVPGVLNHDDKALTNTPFIVCGCCQTLAHGWNLWVLRAGTDARRRDARVGPVFGGRHSVVAPVRPRPLHQAPESSED